VICETLGIIRGDGNAGILLHCSWGWMPRFVVVTVAAKLTIRRIGLDLGNANTTSKPAILHLSANWYQLLLWVIVISAPVVPASRQIRGAAGCAISSECKMQTL